MRKKVNTDMSERGERKSVEKRTFLERWSQRKMTRPGHRQVDKNETIATAAPDKTANSPDAQLPAIETLHEDSNVGVFLAEDVSDAIQRLALRKLFHFGKFNICDGLDDYAEDYTIFEPVETLLAAKDRLGKLRDSLNTEQYQDTAREPAASTIDTDTGSQASDDSAQKPEQQD